MLPSRSCALKSAETSRQDSIETPGACAAIRRSTGGITIGSIRSANRMRKCR